MTGVGIDLGLRIGFSPSDTIPFYLVVEYNYLFNAYLLDWDIFYGGSGVGIGAVFYPTEYFQLGAAIGLSIGNFKSTGFAWNITTAFDLNSGNCGCLFGINYIGGKYLTNGPTDEQWITDSILGVFVKFVYRE